MTSPHIFLALVAALALERFFEFVLSIRNARRAFARGAVETGRAHYRAMVTVHVLFLASCAAEATLWPHRVAPAPQLFALAAALGAQALRYWAVWTLGERWNTRIIVVPDVAPVTAGPYCLMRHPNYLAIVIEMAAVPIIGGAYVTAIAFSFANAILLAVRIPAEEGAMGARYAREFGGRSRFIPGAGRG